MATARKPSAVAFSIFFSRSQEDSVLPHKPSTVVTFSSTIAAGAIQVLVVSQAPESLAISQVFYCFLSMASLAIKVHRKWIVTANKRLPVTRAY